MAPPPQAASYGSEPRWSAPDGRYEADPYAYRNAEPDDGWGRRGSGIGPLAIGGFVLLGVLAILLPRSKKA